MTIDREALTPGKWFRHSKRGTVYEIIGTGELQASFDSLVDGSSMVVYRGEDGRIWCREEGEFLDGRFAALPALDQPAQEPVAWMYHYPGELEYGWQRYEFKRRIQSYEGMSCNEEDAGMIETPLYAAPQPATLPDDLTDAISQLRALCNDKIRKINQGRGVKTEGFRDINDLLKACDKVFATLPDESR